MRSAAVVSGVLVALAACRDRGVTLIPAAELPPGLYAAPTAPPSPGAGPEPLPIRTGIVYMVRKGRLVEVQRTLPPAETLPEALLAGLLEGAPDGAKAATKIPEGTRLLDVGVVGGVATVDLSQEFERGAAGPELALRVAQVVYTLTEARQVNAVLFAVEGTPAAVIAGDERVVRVAVGREDYDRFSPREPV